MKPLFVGYAENRERLELTEKDLETHVHGIGASRSGKSKLIEWMAREMVRDGQGFCLIDPHGHLYNDILRWLTFHHPKREILLFNPSSSARIVGFNPFMGGRGDVSARVDRRVRATVKAWGQPDTDQTPRLERWLRCLYHTLIAGGHSIDVAQYLLTQKYEEIRKYLVRSVPSELIRNEWEELDGLTRMQDFSDQVQSAKNRLFRFIDALQVKRVMGLWQNNIDLEEIIEGGKILLVNLQPSDDLTEPNAELVGTLLLNEVWEVGMRRRQTPAGGPPKSYFIIIDEFQKFLTPDVPAMLDQAAKYGLHLMLFHQHLSQLRAKDEEAFGSVMTNARVKLVFGGLSREDARLMAEQVFPGQLDFTKVKYILEQTKFWPVYDRDTVYTRSSGGAAGMAAGEGSVATSGETWNPSLAQWVPSAGESLSSTQGRSESESWQEGEADIPVYRPVPFKEPSSVQLYSLEEMLWQAADRMMVQYQRHFMVRRPGQKTVAAVTPFVKTWPVRPERVTAFVEETLKNYLTAHQVDAALEAVHRRLQLAARTGQVFRPEDAWGAVLDEPGPEK